MKKRELMGENGFVLAAKAMGKKVKEVEKSGLIGVETWIPTVMERAKSGRLTSVAGSPKLYVYNTDFGWGKPSKVELVHIESGDVISLAESRDEQGGIEVGLALNMNQMDEFVAIFEQSLKLL
ncbi:Transferase [Corchorus olitorius]|uniref:Transferase n=1 Tax=Corchorus olitorius TaxID=93759 RepID=A0A1R3GZ50_9ROSI|nr:Transferase [Corchorus olitorius]